MSLVNLLLRLVACCAVAYAAWRVAGAQGLVFSSVVFGVVLARPIVECVASASGYMRYRAYRNVQGRHFSYEGRSIDIVEDDQAISGCFYRTCEKFCPTCPEMNHSASFSELAS